MVVLPDPEGPTMPRISPGPILEVGRVQDRGRAVFGAIRHAFEANAAGDRRQRRQHTGRAFDRLVHQFVDALEGGAHRLELMPRRHELPHRL